MITKITQSAGKASLALVALVAIVGIIILVALSHPVPDVLSGLAIAAVSALGGATVPIPSTTTSPSAAGISNALLTGEDLAQEVATALHALGVTHSPTSPAVTPATVVTTVTPSQVP